MIDKLVIISLILCGAATSSHGAGFLEEELPLTIVATTPTDIFKNETSLELSGQETVTVVFSRAVVALGSDFGLEELPKDLVPFTFGQSNVAQGRFRWVTTSIARWDPTTSWPPDLDTELIWNKELKTFSGIPLQLNVPSKIKITSPPLQVTILGVGSLEALDLADGHWDAQKGLGDDLLPEVPPDGSIIIRFSYPVELAKIQSALKVYTFNDEKGKDRSEKNIRPVIKRCVSLNTTLHDDEGVPLSRDCAIIQLEGKRLKMGVRYALVLPAGTRYNEKAGPLSEEVFVDFYGLRKFKIPFLWNMRVKKKKSKVPEQDRALFVNGRNVTMWVPHGLSKDTKLEDLKKAITLEWFPWKYMFQKKFPMDFNLSLIDKGTLSLSADFQPAETYKIFVKASDKVRDGYGLPLESSEVKFPTTKLSSFMAVMHQDEQIALEGSQNWDGLFPIVKRGDPGEKKKRSVRVFAFDPKSTKEATKLGWQFHPENYASPETFLKLKKPEISKNLPKTTELSITELDLGNARKKSGMLAVAIGDRKISEIFILNYHVFLTMTANTESSSNTRKVTMWLVDTATGKPAEGVEIGVFRRNKDYDAKELVFVEDITTNSDGVASFVTPPCEEYYDCSSYSFWIKQADSGSVMWHNTGLATFESDVGGMVSKGSLLEDRALVEPGDKIRFMGHLVTRDGKQVKPYGQSNEKDANLRLDINPPFDPELPNYSSQTFNFEVHPEFGTFEITLDVPESTTPGKYTASIVSDYDSTFDGDIGTVHFVVGEPRLPTATMELVTPLWVKPSTPFTVEVLIKSLLGVVIEDAEMTLEYSVNLENEEDIRETATLVTNSTGGASHEINLAAFEGITVGDVVSIEVTWIGPTRERIREEAQLRVQESDKSITMRRLFDSHLPGMEFGVFAEVDQVEVGAVEGIPMEVALYRLPDDIDVSEGDTKRRLKNPEDKSVALQETAKCSIKSGDVDSLEDCRISMPDFGKYLLRGCFDDTKAGNGVVCGTMFLGKTSSHYDDSPLSDTMKVEMMLAKKALSIGDPVEVFIDIPLDNFSVMMVWGNERTNKHKVFSFQEKGLKRISIDLGDDCIGKCQLAAHIGAARQTAAIGQGFHTAVDFDPLGPSTYEVRPQTISYEGENVPFKLNVTVAFNGVDLSEEDIETPVMAPGEKAKITVSVTRCPGKPHEAESIACENPVPAEDAEVMVVVVDKAYLVLSGTPFVELSRVLATDLLQREFLSMESWMKILHTPSMFKKALEIIQRRLDLDPWTARSFIDYSHLSSVWHLSSDFDISDEEILKRRLSAVTLDPPFLPSFLGLLGRELQQPTQKEDTGPSARSPGEGAAEPELRSQADFEVTPLFKAIKTKANGKGEVEFEAPANVGTFVIRAYATTKDAQHGGGEGEIISRLPLSLTPSTPRLVRIGDEFEGGTIITLGGDQVDGVPVTVSLLADPEKANNIEFMESVDGNEPQVVGSQGCAEGDLSCLITLEKKVIKSDSDGQVEVRFRFNAARLGDANITIRADAPGGSDALQMTFPVLGQQEPVRVATSFAIQAKEKSNIWEEGLQFPEAVPGSGVIELRAGVGKLPSVLSAAESILKIKPRKPEANSALANITLPHILSLYGFKSGDAQFDRARGAFVEAGHSLKIGNLTSNEWGLMYYPEEDAFRRDSVSTYLNSWGLWVVNQLKNPGKELEKLRDLWKEKLERQIVEDVEQYLRDNYSVSLYSLARYRLALGPVWEPLLCPQRRSRCTNQETANALAMERLSSEVVQSENFLDRGIEIRASIALTWLAHLGKEAGSQHPDVKAVINSFKTSIRTVGQTAYVSVSPTSAAKASAKNQALALLVFVRAGETNPLVEKLVNHVANEDSGSSVFFWTSPSATIVRMLAMAEYDQSRGSTSPDLDISARSNENTLLEAEFRKPTDPLVTTSTPFEDLGEDPDPLMFRSQGKGEVSLVATLDFTPAKLLPFPTYRGIFVERIVRKAGPDGEAVGEPLKTAPLGMQLVITLQITTPDDLDAVTVRALMPGGIEPVDPNLATDSDARTVCALERLRISFFNWYWPLCPVQTTRPSEVKFSYTRLRSGTNVCTFQATAASVGEWILPPVQAFVDEQPEVMGLSPAGKFKICEGCKSEPLAVEAPPKPCPNNCNDSGICDLTRGVCECDVGFVGKDCGELEIS
ncbi:hypothetical protein BSKO_11032 [Bryopsis sp. KO-2023]|nr:hypothetical protein BSKO_11032 [Bryopsis sp. KO-2023]